MRKQVMVIGLGRFGISLAKALNAMGHDVLAIDSDEKAVQSVAADVTHAVQADATDEAVLKDLGSGNFDVAVVTIASDIQNSVLTTILLKKLGIRYIISRAQNDLHGSILEKIGADKVVYVEGEMGIELAHGLTMTNVTHYMPLERNYGVMQLTAPDYFVGKSLAKLELGAKGKWKMAVLLIKREKEIIVMPDLQEIIQLNDTLILAGNDDNLEQALTDAQKSSETQSPKIETNG